MVVDLEKVRALVEPIAVELGYELVAVRFLTDQGRNLLRLMIEREGGVTVGDCQRISREVETLIEVEGAVRIPYDLEVSSPGLDRPLVKEADYARFAGQQAAVRTRAPIDGRRNYKGLLTGIEGGEVVMEVDGKEFRIPFAAIEKAHLCYKI